MKLCIILALIGATSTVLAAQEVELGCKRLHVVLDERLTTDVVDRDWASGMAHAEPPATLELLGCDGRPLSRLALEAPLARIDSQPVRGAPHPTFLVSADLTAEAGSYNGPLTIAVEVVQNHLRAVNARTANGGNEPVRLTLSGKAAWKRLPAQGAEVLLLVSSRPKAGGFETIYRRYAPSRQQWVVKAVTREGLWESDGEFPKRNQFP